jgi:hypothetical protein
LVFNRKLGTFSAVDEGDGAGGIVKPAALPGKAVSLAKDKLVLKVIGNITSGRYPRLTTVSPE